MFLTDAEVAEFTGFKRHSAQMEWLALHDHKFVLNGQGRVIVLRAYVENLLGLNQPVKLKKQIEPNWAAVNE